MHGEDYRAGLELSSSIYNSALVLYPGRELTELRESTERLREQRDHCEYSLDWYFAVYNYSKIST
jgi:hypothetical protein